MVLQIFPYKVHFISHESATQDSRGKHSPMDYDESFFSLREIRICGHKGTDLPTPCAAVPFKPSSLFCI